MEQAAADPLLQRVAAFKRQIDFDFITEDIVSLIRETQSGLERVCKIVQDLKDFARAGETERWQLANLEAGLDSTLSIAINEIKYKAQLHREYGGIPDIECLPSQLNQVFLNLLVNAAQAIDEQGDIWVRTGADQDQVWVDICDNGCGIKPEHIGRVFDPFFTTKPVGQGTGLGLSMSYGIVQKHGGHIEIDSTVGQGSRFRVLLPQKQIERAVTGDTSGDI
jgi:signal transduction histidine kinase